MYKPFAGELPLGTVTLSVDDQTFTGARSEIHSGALAPPTLQATELADSPPHHSRLEKAVRDRFRPETHEEDFDCKHFANLLWVLQDYRNAEIILLQSVGQSNSHDGLSATVLKQLEQLAILRQEALKAL